MASSSSDPVIRPVDRGLGPNLQQLRGSQRTGDGQTDPGAGLSAARTMTGGGAVDASTVGGLKQDSPGKFAHLPGPMRSLISRALAKGPGPQSR